MHGQRLLTKAIAVAILVAPAMAGAQQDDRQRAREAYERGTQAYKRGDFAAAAAAYREADDAAPSPVALQAALDAAVKADEPVLGNELLERARGRKVEGALAASVKAAEAKLAHRAGRVHLTCGKPCSATLDGSALADGATRWASLGDHTVTVAIEGRQANVHASVTADQIAEVVAPSDLVNPPPQPPPPPVAVTEQPPPTPTYSAQPASFQPIQPQPHAETSSGVGRGWFWVGLGVTIASGVATGLFFANASSDHDAFVAGSCSKVASTKCSSIASDGMASQIVGNVFVGIGVVAAVWTFVSGVWLVHWASGSGVRASVGPQGGALMWTQSF